jgi:mono/diheme cytochrome c family protein
MTGHERSGAAWLNLAAAASVLTTLGLSPALAADPANGEQVARRWCAACHVVAPNQSSPTSEARPFTSIARAPDFDTAAIAMFLLKPHPKMPDMSLTPKEATDLAAYIASLK